MSYQFCMIPREYFRYSDTVTNHYFFLTERMDGARCITLVEEDAVCMFSPQCVPMHTPPAIEADLSYLSAKVGKSFVMDGILSLSDGCYYVFDILDLDSFINCSCHTPYYQRRQRLEAYCDLLPTDYAVRASPVIYAGSDKTQIAKALERYNNGLIIHLAEEFYQFCRTSAMLEAKKE